MFFLLNIIFLPRKTEACLDAFCVFRGGKKYVYKALFFKAIKSGRCPTDLTSGNHLLSQSSLGWKVPSNIIYATHHTRSFKDPSSLALYNSKDRASTASLSSLL